MPIVMQWRELAEFIRNTGFPIAVASWLLYRLDTLISDNTRAIQAVQVAVAKIIDICGRVNP